ncbi:MAG: nucleotidyl transferase AbiEii/AbiGii toxin family protein [Candidatus Sabulitectum sp.]|nr:nucleotidyl transferase AbiEii/AbiGii toxin family protein [Candidatus Sabulitectum sp.]
MLQYRTVYPETLGLLKELMQLPCLQDFFLVGGTALALQIGHRISVDIDMFSLSEFDSEELLSQLVGQFIISNAVFSKNTLSFDAACHCGRNEIVKVDLIRHSYPLINAVRTIDDIRLLSTEDIVAMKLSAIAGRGFKKDFYDIAYLLDMYSLEEMLTFFKKKYPETNEFQILKSLTYFDDADSTPDPETADKIEWKEIKKKIAHETASYISKLQ